jgi:hypothetical protein
MSKETKQQKNSQHFKINLKEQRKIIKQNKKKKLRKTCNEKCIVF